MNLIKESAEASMTFGKHRGIPLGALNTAYLIWALSVTFGKPNHLALANHLSVLVDDRLTNQRTRSC